MSETLFGGGAFEVVPALFGSEEFRAVAREEAAARAAEVRYLCPACGVRNFEPGCCAPCMEEGFEPGVLVVERPVDGGRCVCNVVGPQSCRPCREPEWEVAAAAVLAARGRAEG